MYKMDAKLYARKLINDSFYSHNWISNFNKFLFIFGHESLQKFYSH